MLEPSTMPPSAADGDAADLSAWAGARDEVAFARVVRRHAGMVASICRHRLGGPAEIDEAVQAVFLVLARRASEIDPPRLAAWLHGVAWKVCRRCQRTSGRRVRHERVAARHAEDLRRAALPEETVWEDLQPLLHDAIAGLRPAQRDVVIGHFIEGLSHAAIAIRLGISEDAVRMRIGYALGRLRSWFARRGMTAGVAGLAVGLGLFAAEAQSAEPSLVAAGVRAGTRPGMASSAVERLADGAMESAGPAVLGVAGVLIAAAAALPLCWSQPAVASRPVPAPAPMMAPSAAGGEGRIIGSVDLPGLCWRPEQGTVTAVQPFAWSGDAAYVVVYPSGVQAVGEIHTWRPGAPVTERIATLPFAGSLSVFQPLPDGRILYRGADGPLWIRHPDGRTAVIAEMGSDGRTRFPSGAVVASGDARWLAYDRLRTGGSDPVLIDVDAGTERVLTHPAGGAWRVVDWETDGSLLLRGDRGAMASHHPARGWRDLPQAPNQDWDAPLALAAVGSERRWRLPDGGVLRRLDDRGSAVYAAGPAQARALDIAHPGGPPRRVELASLPGDLWPVCIAGDGHWMLAERFTAWDDGPGWRRPHAEGMVLVDLGSGAVKDLGDAWRLLASRRCLLTVAGPEVQAFDPEGPRGWRIAGDAPVDLFAETGIDPRPGLMDGMAEFGPMAAMMGIGCGVRALASDHVAYAFRWSDAGPSGLASPCENRLLVSRGRETTLVWSESSALRRIALLGWDRHRLAFASAIDGSRDRLHVWVPPGLRRPGGVPAANGF